MAEALTARPILAELLRRLQRELDDVALGTIIRDAHEHRGRLLLDLEVPAHLTPEQHREVDMLVDHAKAAARYLLAGA
jgi:hypothetical protein